MPVQDPCPSGARTRVVFVMDAQLAKAVKEGTYTVDARAVADAIFGRVAPAAGRRVPLAHVLEALEREGIAGAVADHESRPGGNAA